MVTPNREELIQQVARRIDRGESLSALAKEFKVARVTVWRWNNEAIRNEIPDFEYRQTWRQEIAATYAERITNALDTGNDDALIAYTAAMRKLLGLDHNEFIQEAQLHIEAKKLELIATALDRAAETAGIAVDDRIRLAHALDETLAELEEATRR